MSKRGGALKIPPAALRLERRMRLAVPCSCVFAATVFGHDPVLAETVGTAISIKTKVAAEQTGAQRVLTVGAGVAQDEMIQTDDSGNAQLKFVDETLLVIGPSSSIKLDKILFAPNRKAKMFVLEAVAGAFRFASGKSSHSAYEIHTPIATIGVRGTQFAFGIQGDEVTVVVTQGSVSSCIRATARCVTVAAGNTIVSTPSGAVVRRTLGAVPNVLRTVLTLPTPSRQLPDLRDAMQAIRPLDTPAQGLNRALPSIDPRARAPSTPNPAGGLPTLGGGLPSPGALPSTGGDAALARTRSIVSD
jgi:FecR protein